MNDQKSSFNFVKVICYGTALSVEKTNIISKNKSTVFSSYFKVFQVKKTLIKILFLCFIFVSHGILQGQTTEYKLKAAFLERFTRFVEWPDLQTELTDSIDTFKITVIGDNPFGTALEDLYKSTRIKNREVKIKYISEISDIDSCHLLFISGSLENGLEKILAYTKGNPILTVSDRQGFAKRGVIINFFVANNKLRFEINKEALSQSKLYMSYLLLNVARIVKNEEGDK